MLRRFFALKIYPMYVPPWHIATGEGTSSAQIQLNRTVLYFKIIIFCVDT